MPDSIILLSGGIDSATIAWSLRGTHTNALFVDYHQPAGFHELRAATGIAKECGLRLWKMATHVGQLQHMCDGPGVRGPRVVPGRNALLLSIAASFLPQGGTVYIGATADDAKEYSDCRPEFLEALNTAFVAAYGVKVVAPLLTSTKLEVVASLPRDIVTMTWSCYAPRDGQQCGECDACLEVVRGRG